MVSCELNILAQPKLLWSEPLGSLWTTSSRPNVAQSSGLCGTQARSTDSGPSAGGMRHSVEPGPHTSLFCSSPYAQDRNRTFHALPAVPSRWKRNEMGRTSSLSRAASSRLPNANSWPVHLVPPVSSVRPHISPSDLPLLSAMRPHLAIRFF